MAFRDGMVHALDTGWVATSLGHHKRVVKIGCASMSCAVRFLTMSMIVRSRAGIRRSIAMSAAVPVNAVPGI